MGQVAEDMQDGSCCELCGCYFQHPSGTGIYVHDRPAVCEDCWGELNTKEQKKFQKCDNGILTF